MHRADLIEAALALGFDHAEWIDNQQILALSVEGFMRAAMGDAPFTVFSPVRIHRHAQ